MLQLFFTVASDVQLNVLFGIRQCCEAALFSRRSFFILTANLSWANLYGLLYIHLLLSSIRFNQKSKAEKAFFSRCKMTLT